MSGKAIGVTLVNVEPGQLKRFCGPSGLGRSLLVTGLVLAGPLAVSWALAATGLVTSPWVTVVMASGLTMLVCQLAGLWWQRNRQSEDLLFSDLLLWGWLRRQRMERRLADAAQFFSATADAADGGSLRIGDPLVLLRQLAADLEAADPYTHGHSRRVARYASLIARAMDLPPDQVKKIRLAAAVHDIGKLHTPRGILDKPGQLTEIEYEVVKLHAGDGAEMIAKLVDDPELVAIVRHHHERLDGRGYPDELAGEAIPLGARIIAVADTFDAITSRRAYRQSRAHKAAMDIMREEAGKQLDPDAVRAFRSAYFGRRWLWVPAAVTSIAGRLLAGIAEHVTGTAAIAAGTAALGALPFVLPGLANTASTRAPAARPAASHTARTALASGHGLSVLTAKASHSAALRSPVNRGGSSTGRHQRVSIAPRSSSGAPAQSRPVPTGSQNSSQGTAASPAPVSGTTVHAGGTTVSTSGSGASASTSVPGAAASATASPQRISGSASAAGASVGLTINTGLPAGLLSPSPTASHSAPSSPGISGSVTLPGKVTVPLGLSAG